MYLSRFTHIAKTYQDYNKGGEKLWSELSLWLSSTLKKRKAKMNKHKLRKRRKRERLKPT